MGHSIASPDYARAALGQQIRERRTALGLTVRELADLADVDQQAIYQIEYAKKMPSVGLFLRLADALKIRPSRLAEALDPPKTISKKT